MNEQTILQHALEEIGSYVKSPILKSLGFDSVEPTNTDWYLAQLSHSVQPSYLPFASDDSGLLSVYLKPELDILASPVVYISLEGRRVHFVCDSFSTFPTGLWLWVARYFKDDHRFLRVRIEALASDLPNAQLPAQQLWQILESSADYEPTWWTDTCYLSTQRAWIVGNVGHPFVGLPQIPDHVKPEMALSSLQPFIEIRPEPELLSVLIATQLKAGISVKKADVLAVLRAEAWRQADCFFEYSRWRVDGEGLCAWDVVLSNLPNAHSILDGTEFALLAEYQDVYNSEDQSPLYNLACNLQKQKAFTVALSQARNAARVSVLSGNAYDVATAELSAQLCDAISPGSIAAAVARRSVQIDRDDL